MILTGQGLKAHFVYNISRSGHIELPRRATPSTAMGNSGAAATTRQGLPGPHGAPPAGARVPGAVSTGALVLWLDVHALQQEVPFGTCLLLTQRSDGRLPD